MTTYDHAAPLNAAGEPACQDCGSTRLRVGSTGFAECLGCGSRYAVTDDAAAETEAWSEATPDAADHGRLEDAPPVVREPTTADRQAEKDAERASKGGRMTWVGAAVAIVIGVAVWAVFRTGTPDDCRTVPASEAADLTEGLTASDFGAVASLARDGGTYIVADAPTLDAKLAWFQTPGGTTYTVGAVTQLYSNFPEAADHTMAGIGTDGYDQAMACLRG